MVCCCSAPKRFEARKFVLSQDAMDSGDHEAGGIAKKAHLDWGRAPARELQRLLVVGGGAKKRSLVSADEVVGQCEACEAFGKAPRLPAAGTSPASSVGGELGVALSLRGDGIALRAMDVYSTVPSWFWGSPGNPPDVSHVSAGFCISVLGRRRTTRMDAGG